MEWLKAFGSGEGGLGPLALAIGASLLEGPQRYMVTAQGLQPLPSNSPLASSLKMLAGFQAQQSGAALKRLQTEKLQAETAKLQRENATAAAEEAAIPQMASLAARQVTGGTPDEASLLTGPLASQFETMQRNPIGRKQLEQILLGPMQLQQAINQAGPVAEAQQAAAAKYRAPPTDVQEYEYAKKQGYTGTFAQFQQEMRKAGASSTTVNVSGPSTPAQKKVDEEFAKDYAAIFAGGGAADVEKNIAQLNEVREQLRASASGKGPALTGPVVGNVPDIVGAFTNPAAIAAREQVEEVVQRNLRIVLGPQFTEKEGERLIARAFNPTLRPEENIARLDRLITAMEEGFKAKQAAAAYYEQYGSLAGFKGAELFSKAAMEKAIGDPVSMEVPKKISPDDARRELQRRGLLPK